MESKSVIVFYWEFFADVELCSKLLTLGRADASIVLLSLNRSFEIIVKAIIVLIDYSHAAIGRRNLQNLQQMPFRFAKVIGFSVKDDAVGNEVSVVCSLSTFSIPSLP